ncbi:glycosyltransferase [Faecalibacterium sp.]|uniref:glycosyltransferase n=1 Tax=Faecalibacterium sp. TaxID=1971605 RepID=UPI003993114B
MSEKPCGAYFFAFFENFFVPILTSGGLAAVSSSAFAALYSAFGRYDVVHIHAEGPAFFAWLPKMFGKRVVVTVHGECEIIWATREKPDFMRVYAA